MPTFTVDGHESRWERTGTLRGRPLLVLGHGAGAPLNSPFLEHVAKGLARREVAVLRFHFPYMERAQREGRTRPPDPRGRLLSTLRAVLEVARRRRGHGPILIGGKSMGGRMASHLLAEAEPEAVADVRGAVYLGYPLHPAGKPEKRRDAHLPAVRVPQLFVQGTRDPLGPAADVREIVRGLEGARLHVVEGGDHSLAPSRKDPFRGSDAWLDAIAAFARER